MKLSVSNIAWGKENDEEMYNFLKELGISGLEIAPTRIIEEKPYSKIEEAKRFSKDLYDRYNLKISSMQSIWYKREEKIFKEEQDRKALLDYTKKAIDFAEAIDCKNLVFGSPKNRIVNNIQNDYKIALEFFREIGMYAKSKNVYFSIEPNPKIYGTNFITTTKEAVDIVKDINNDGIKINLDLGTIIQNEEELEVIKENLNLINHIHISEPNLECIKQRNIHKELIDILKLSNYKGYISVEMKKQEKIENVKKVIEYILEII